MTLRGELTATGLKMKNRKKKKRRATANVGCRCIGNQLHRLPFVLL
jgi:hypothetical protein